MTQIYDLHYILHIYFTFDKHEASSKYPAYKYKQFPPSGQPLYHWVKSQAEPSVHTQVP